MSSWWKSITSHADSCPSFFLDSTVAEERSKGFREDEAVQLIVSQDSKVNPSYKNPTRITQDLKEERNHEIVTCLNEPTRVE